jgi:predicted dehydrogenase
VLRYMKHFEECLAKDREPVPSVIDGAKTIAVGHAAYQSIREGKAVKVFNEF